MDRYRVHDWVKFNYSEIGEYISKGYTDKPLRNDELVKILNLQDKQIEELEKHIRVNTINKMTIEDVLDDARYNKFYKNKEIIKAIDYIAEQLGILYL